MGSPQRTAKRIYSPAALEFWFRKLDTDWEPRFSKRVLDRGRELYTRGIIRELELGEGDAIIHCKLEKQAFYAMVEWENGHLRVRGSVERVEFNESVAAAGLYEIEELVADEVSAVSPQPASKVDGAAGSADSGESDTVEVPTPGEAEKPVLEIVLRVDRRGLVADPGWRRMSSADARHNRETEYPERSERESMVRLTGLARKSGFEYLSRQGFFLLRDPRRILPFLREEVESWKRFFKIEPDAEVRRLGRGVQTLELVGKARASKADRGGMVLEWGLRAGGVTLGTEDALRLARRGRGPALVPGVGLVELEERRAEMIEEWTAAHGAEGDRPRYLLFSRFVRSIGELELAKELELWRQQVEELQTRSWPVPSLFRGYQARGVAWLAGQCEMGCHPLLADEMGLGKTLQVLGLMAARPLEGDDAARAHLVVCPASVVPVWRNEIRRYFPQFPVKVLKAGETFRSAGYEKEPVIWLASYTQLRRHRHLLADSRFGYAVLDEAQQIKNPEAKVTQACLQIQAVHRLALTGTPLENRAMDLWSLFRFLMPGLLGSRLLFERGMQGEERERFFKAFKHQVRPFILRRTKAEVMAELPPKVEMEVACPMTTFQVKRYRQLTEEGRLQFGESLEASMGEESMHFFALLTRLRQVCCDPGLLPGTESELQNSGKLVALLDKLEPILECGSKVVIFSQFTTFLERIGSQLQKAFPHVPRYELTGSSRDREEPVRTFQDSAGSALFLVSLRAGGVGITLHAADYVFLMDPWWNPAVEAQAIDRVHRIGQDKPVFVYRMIARGTVEERVQALKTEKRELFDDLVGELNGWSGLAESFRNLSDLVELLPEDNG